MDARVRSYVGAAALALALLTVVAAADDRAPSRSPAPRFKTKDLAGHPLDLDRLLHRGPVVLDFWATWCAPCIEALPELEGLHRRYGELGLTVIGVSVDGPRNFSRIRPFVASKGLHYPIVLDADGRLQQLYHVLAIPTAVLIDTTGSIVAVRVAYRPGEGDRFEDSVRVLLPEAPAR
jgi:peroxiredoxin